VRLSDERGYGRETERLRAKWLRGIFEEGVGGGAVLN
jgi:hypothetical protein